jgi:iron complex transport system substrate-binding protein
MLCNLRRRLLFPLFCLALTFEVSARELIEEASHLSIETRPYGYAVEVDDPVQSGKILSYQLVSEGNTPPAKEDEGLVIRIPVERIVSLSTTYIGPFEALNSLGRIVAIDRGKYAYSTRLRDSLEKNEVVEVGTSDQLDIESVIAAKPDLVLMTRITPGQGGIESRLAAAGIPVLVTAAWKENSPLARSEWIKLFGVLVDSEAKATELFEWTQKRYRDLQEIVTEAAPVRPRVLWSAPFGGVWYVPGGASYSARFLNDAGAEYLWEENDQTGSFPIDFESAIAAGFSAEYWFSPGQYRSLAALANADERFRSLPLFQEKRVFNRTRRISEAGGNDFFESGIVHPDRILADMIHILHPELLPDHKLFYFERLPLSQE